MALFYYQAFAKDGKKVTGTVDAPSVQQAKEQLSKQGMYPISVVPATQETTLAWYQRFFIRSLSLEQKILFTKQLTILLKAGVPLLQALELLVEQFEGTLKTMLIAIKDEIKEGSSLANALKKYPKAFDNIYVQLVRAGEASGKLEVILERLTGYLERQLEIKKRFRSAMLGPLLQLGVAGIVVIGMMIFVVPMMAENFAKQGKELPTITQILIGISYVFTHYFWLIGILLALGIAGFLYWKSTPSGGRMWDTIKLRIPLVKYFAKTNAIVQFSYTLGLLLEGGVNLAESLDIVVSTVDNRILADTLQEARDKIIKQGKIAQYLKQTELFPPIAIYLINTGEQSGQLDAMLLTVARNYEVELTELTDSLVAKIGPLMLISMAVVVGFIVLALVMPIMEFGDIEGI